jgi:hypothetical protein
VSFHPARLRPPEWALGGTSLALLVAVFALHWYGGANGWQSLTVLGPFAALVGVLGIAAWLLQASQGAPALPVTAAVVELALGIILVIGLIIRVVTDPPRLGGYLGLVLAFLVALAAYASLRRDGVADADAPKWIETLPL